MNPEKIDLSVRICKNLPLDWTLHQKNGVCKKIEANCDYQLCPSLPICRKKSTTAHPLRCAT